MKTTTAKWFILLTALVGLSAPAMAQAFLQDPRYGPNEEARRNCAINLSLYREFFNQNNFEAARGPWLRVLQICPAASQNAYIHGMRMMRHWIEAERHPARRAQLIDSLMLLYDMRIEHFDRRGFLLGQKGVDLFTFAPDRYEEAYRFIEQSIALERTATELPVFLTYMLITKNKFEKQKMGAEQVIDTYSRISDYLNAIAASRPSDRVAQVKENIDGLFTSMGVVTCENLAQIFGPRIRATPDDFELVRKIFNLLVANRCHATPFYKELAQKVFSREPTAPLAYELARLFAGAHRDFRSAERFYQEAIRLESDSLRRSVYLVEYANMVSQEFNNPQQARSLAQQALAINPGMGHAHVLIGHLYAAEKNCGPDAFTRSTVFWPAVDRFVRAKQADPGLTAEANRFIDLYSKYFPEAQDIFFQDLTIGSSYLVGCWINERTTVRARP